MSRQCGRDCNNNFFCIKLEVFIYVFPLSLQELVGSSKNRKLKKILLWSIVGAVAIAIIVVLAVFLTRDNNSSGGNPISPDLSAITLEDFLEGRLNPKTFAAEWANNNEVIYRDNEVSYFKLRYSQLFSYA